MAQDRKPAADRRTSDDRRALNAPVATERRTTGERRAFGVRRATKSRRVTEDRRIGNEDLSHTGAGLPIDDASHPSIGDEVVLTIEGHGDFVATIRRVDDGKIGLMFVEKLTDELPS